MRMIKVGRKIVNLDAVSCVVRSTVDDRLVVCFAGDGDDTLTLEGGEADAFEAFVADEAYDVMGRAGSPAASPLLLAACRAAFAHVGSWCGTRDDAARVLRILNEAIAAAESGA